MHLDPDFQHLTYGEGPRAGWLNRLEADDLVVFYSGFQSVHPARRQPLIYALTGLYVVEEVIGATEIPRERWGENAHTRRRGAKETDIIVRAKAGVSGRLERCIPIGEWREAAYRVRPDILTAWGGLRVKNGFIQRAAAPIAFLDVAKFYQWFLNQKIPLVRSNN